MSRRGLSLVKFFVLSILFLFSQISFAGTNNGIVYHGRIVAPDGEPINSGTASFSMQVYGRSTRYWDGSALQTGNTRCLLYQESHTKSMVGSLGAFELIVGDGSSPVWGVGATAADRRISKLFVNNPLDTGNYIKAISCTLGNSLYFPSGPDATAPEWVDRELVVSITVNGTSFTLSPMTIKSQPFAIQAQQVGGFSPQSLFRIDGNSILKFTPFQHDFLANSISRDGSSVMRLFGLPAVPVSATEATSKAYVDAQIATAIIGGGGSAASVTGTAPIQSSGGTNPAISISQASATIPGYLAAADWVTFNNKLSAITGSGLVSVSGGSAVSISMANQTIAGRYSAGSGAAEAISIGSGLSLSAGGVLTASSAGTVTSVTGVGPISATAGASPAISISLATGSVGGYLSAADWTSFNNKLGTASVFAGDVSGNYNSNFIIANAVTTAKISDAQVTVAKMAASGTQRIFGRYSASSGPGEEISIGSGLSLSGAGVLTASGSSNAYVNGGNAFGANASIGTTDIRPLSILTNNSPAISISQSGNVGIGMTNPGTKLDVASNVLSGNTIVPLFRAIESSTSNGLAAGYVVNSGGTAVRSGFIATTTGVDLWLGTQAPYSNLVISSSTGNVGIGTTNPSYPLDVRGTIQSSGTAASAGILRISEQNTNGNNFIAFRPAASLSTDTTFTWPSNGGDLNQVLTTDGAGNLSWATPAAGGITAVTGSGPISSSGGATPSLSISTASATVSGALGSVDWVTFNNKLSAITGSGLVSISGGNAVSISMANQTLAGRFSAGSGAAEAISIGSGLSLSGGGVLTAPAVALTSAAISTAGGYVQGGNAFGANASIGTTDNRPLSIIANNSPAVAISQNGAVGFGVTGSPNGRIEVAGSGYGSFGGLPTLFATTTANGMTWNSIHRNTTWGSTKYFGQWITNAGNLHLADSFDGTTFRDETLVVSGSAGTVGIGVVGGPGAGISLDVMGVIRSRGLAGAGNGGSIRLGEVSTNGSNYIAFKSADSLSTDTTFLWPSNGGSLNQVLTTDGAGNLSWANPAAGGITAVNGSGPISSSGGATPSLSISTASATVSGALGSVDWVTFNNKLSSITGSGLVSVSGGNAVSISMANQTLAGRYSAGSGVAQEISIGSGLSLSGGGVLTASGSSQWTTSGSNIYYNTGKVSIGTSSPSNEVALEVLGPNFSSTNPFLVTLEDTTAMAQDVGAGIGFQGQDGITGRTFAVVRGGKENGTSGNYAGYFAAFARVNGASNPVERLRVSSAGNVGIGTTAPGVSLDVTGAIRSGPIGTGAGNTGRIILGDLAAGTQYYTTIRAADTLSSDNSWVLPGGNGDNGQVLTTNGAGVLSWTTPSSGGVTAQAVSDAGGWLNGGNAFGVNASIGTKDNRPLSILINNSPAMSISQSGYVGIGTTNPAAPLTIGAQTNVADGDYGDLYYGLLVGGTPTSPDSNNAILMGSGGWGNNPIIRMKTSTGTKGYFGFEGSELSFFMGVKGGSVPLKFKTNGSDRMTITTTGEIGVGKAAGISYPLDVRGTIQAQGSAAGGQLQLAEAPSTGNNFVALKAADSLSGDFTLTLPSGAGSLNQVLTTNGSGVLSWTTPSGGGVTSVTGAGPISSSGGTTPSISISQASSTVSGFLTSTNWTTFNNKVSSITGSGMISVAGTTTAPALSISLGQGYLLGRVNTGGAGTASAISIGSGLAMTAGGVLSASGGTPSFPLRGPNGTAAAPTYSFTGATNTGIYLDGAWNTLHLGVAGMAQASFSGYGAFSPRFSIIHSSTTISSTGGVAYAPNTSTDAYDGPSTTDTGGTWLDPGVSLNVNNDQKMDGSFSALKFYGRNTAATEQYAYIGSVTENGAGTFSPTIVMGQKASSTTWNERLRISTSGNVGIGTASPGARLDVADTGTTTSAIIVPRAGAFTGTTVNGMVRYNSTSNLFEFRQNGVWVNYTTVSDSRLKTNVVPVSSTRGLDIVNQLNPVFYDWDKSNPRTETFGDKHQVGFIAQEVEKVLPEVVDVGEDSYRSVEYGKIVSVVVAAVKELYKKVLGMDEQLAAQARQIASKTDKTEFEARLAAKDKEIAAQAKQIEAMKAYLCAKDKKAAICR